ncbi:MAG: hypothetical protein ACLR6J_09590 [Parabacteroides merdae]
MNDDLNSPIVIAHLFDASPRDQLRKGWQGYDLGRRPERATGCIPYLRFRYSRNKR